MRANEAALISSGFRDKATVFVNSAERLHESDNDKVLTEAYFYLLSHAIELGIKAVATIKTEKPAPRSHDKEELSEKYKEECKFSDDDLLVIKKMKDLNNGAGGLRYKNKVIGEFNQETFSKGVQIVRRMLSLIADNSI